MKKLLIAFIVLLVAIALGYLIQQDTGYVLITYQHWMITTSFWVGAFTILLTFIAFYWLIRLLRTLASIPKKLTLHRKTALAHKKYRLLKQGLFDLITGRYKQAEKNLANIAKNTKKPTLFYLLGAISAQKENRIDRRNQLFKRAYQGSKSDILAIRLLQAKLYIENHQYEEALSLCKNIYKTHSKNKAAAHLLLTCYEKLDDWKSIIALLPTIKKLGISTTTIIETLENKAYRELLLSYAYNQNLTDFEALWANAPSQLKTEKILRTSYANLLEQTQNYNKKNQFIETTLKKQWDNDLLSFYMTHKESPKTHAQAIKTAEEWLKNQPNSPQLYFTLARICLQEKLYGKAKEYAIQANMLNETAQSLALLGKISMILEEADTEAANYFKRSAMKLLDQ